MASKWQTKVINEYKKKGYYVINLIKTNKNGIPDLLCLKEGQKPLFIECKEKNDTLKPLQKYRIEELNKLGFKAIVLKINFDNKENIFNLDVDNQYLEPKDAFDDNLPF